MGMFKYFCAIHQHNYANDSLCQAMIRSAKCSHFSVQPRADWSIPRSVRGWPDRVDMARVSRKPRRANNLVALAHVQSKSYVISWFRVFNHVLFEFVSCWCINANCTQGVARAMDTITTVANEIAGTNIQEFMVSGQSKVGTILTLIS